MGPLVVKPASLSSAPAMRATTDPQDAYTAPQTFSPSFVEQWGQYPLLYPVA